MRNRSARNALSTRFEDKNGPQSQAHGYGNENDKFLLEKSEPLASGST